MDIEQISVGLLEQALRSWRKGELPPTELLDLELIKQTDGSAQTRSNSLRDRIHQHIAQQLIACRNRADLPPGEIPPRSLETLKTQIAVDFATERLGLTRWSALYYQYVEGSLDVKDLAKYALGDSARIQETNEREFRRYVHAALKLLTHTVRDWEAEAQRGLRRVQLPAAEYLHDGYYDPTGSLVKELAQLLNAPNGVQILSIEGLGGIGKTALARRVADQVTGHAEIARVIWISARQERFNTGSGAHLEHDDHAARSRADVISALVNKLGYEHLDRLSTEEKVERLILVMAGLRALIIIDNLETLDDSRLLVPDLVRMQGQARFLLTSRDSLSGFDAIHCRSVPQLPFAESAHLLNSELGRLGDKRRLSEAEAHQIYATVGGVPLALKLIAAQLADFLDVSDVLSDIRRAQPNDAPELMFEFIYRRTWRLLGRSARRLLLAIYDAVAPEGADLDWIIGITAQDGLVRTDFKAALSELRRYSLIETIPAHVPRYALHRLTITFLQTNVAQTRWCGSADVKP
ncbi:MAG: NB-ARC domain-containing protein [Aggregatilineales bacterium]